MIEEQVWDYLREAMSVKRPRKEDKMHTKCLQAETEAHRRCEQLNVLNHLSNNLRLCCSSQITQQTAATHTQTIVITSTLKYSFTDMYLFIL